MVMLAEAEAEAEVEITMVTSTIQNHFIVITITRFSEQIILFLRGDFGISRDGREIKLHEIS